MLLGTFHSSTLSDGGYKYLQTVQIGSNVSIKFVWCSDVKIKIWKKYDCSLSLASLPAHGVLKLESQYRKSKCILSIAFSVNVSLPELSPTATV